MTRLFRSKPRNNSIMPPPMLQSPLLSPNNSINQELKQEEEDEGYLGDFNTDEDEDDDDDGATTTIPPFIISPPAVVVGLNDEEETQFSVLGVVAAVLKKSLVTCAVPVVEANDVDIGWPTDVRHVSHVTFDRFNGFLGLPIDLHPHLPPNYKPPSASASVFGVSPQSMQCSYDHRGNSVPTILLRLQNRLNSEAGLQAEGIFRINPENSKEEYVRNQLNKGIVPRNIDVHCLSGLIKAWFRELPYGVLDSLTPEQVMHCNTEQECTQLVKLLPLSEAALLDWAINLMADVVEHEHQNKMNARNIAMVFAPNMTQMADPLTALIHAVQVMNFLKTLIEKTLREREESAPTSLFRECNIDFVKNTQDTLCPSNATEFVRQEQTFDDSSCKETTSDKLSKSVPLDCDNSSKSLDFRSKSDVGEKYESMSGVTSPVLRKRRTLGHSFKDEYESMESEGILNRLSLRKGMQKLRRNPLFQLSKTVKKSVGV